MRPWLQAINEQNKVLKTEEDKQNVIDLYLKNMLSVKQISKIYNCSKFPIAKVLKDIPKRKPSAYKHSFCYNQGFGENHHSWKGGFKSLYDRIRDLTIYWEWRKSVLSRDNNKCTNCGSVEKLHAHHIKTVKSLIKQYCQNNNKQLKDITGEDLSNLFFYNINNGLTLCEPCHKAWHKQYGRK